MLTASLEGFGAARVGRTGVKFDRLGKTLSGQPIFAVDEEIANEIRATFILDLALLRSYGRDGIELNDSQKKGLNDSQKKLLLGLALWKIKSLLVQPFRYRSQCYLKCAAVDIVTEDNAHSSSTTPQEDKEASKPSESLLPPLLSKMKISDLIKACSFTGESLTKVYYPAMNSLKLGKKKHQEKQRLKMTTKHKTRGMKWP